MGASWVLPCMTSSTARTTDIQRELGQTNWAEIYEAYGVFLAKLLRWQPEKKQGFIR